MMPALTPMHRRVAALSILFVVLGVVYGFVVNPLVNRYSANHEQIAQLQQRLAGYRRIASEAPAVKAALNRKLGEIKRAAYFLRNTKHALASAELQELVRGRITAAKGHLMSSQAYDVSRVEGREQVSVEVRVQGDIGVLRSLLFELTTGRPVVFVDDLNVTAYRGRAVGRLAQSPNTDGQMLDIRVRVSAYLASDPQGV